MSNHSQIQPRQENIPNKSNIDNWNITIQNNSTQIDTKSNSKKIFKYANIPSSSRLKRSKDDNLDTYLPSTCFLDSSIPLTLYGNVPTEIVILDWKSQFQLETKYKVKEIQASQKHRRSMSLTTKSPSEQRKATLKALSEVDNPTVSSNQATYIAQKESVTTDKIEKDGAEQERDRSESSVSSCSDDKYASQASYPEYEVRNLRVSYEETLQEIRKSQPDQFYDNFTMTKSSSDSNLSASLHSGSSDSIQLGESVSNQCMPNFNAIKPGEPAEKSSLSSGSSKMKKKKKVSLSKDDQYSHSDSALGKTSGIQKKKHGLFYVFTKLGRKHKSSGSLPQQLKEVNTKISKDPNNLHLYLERARIHVRMGNIELAKHDYDVIQHPSPEMVVRTNNNN